MCYTIEINLTREQIEQRFGVSLTNRRYRSQSGVSAFTLPEVPVIAQGKPENADLFIWGFIPSWIKEEESAASIRKKTFNARSETLAEKPSFRGSLRSKRCMVLINGFYEWQDRGGLKQPFFIRLKNEQPFALAGLYDKWLNRSTGEILNTFTIITTKANHMIGKIHNTKKRMPVILPEGIEKSWIDPGLSQSGALEFLKPFDEKLMEATEVDREIFRRK